MHEFELGVWKNTFIHLLRLLAAQGAKTVQEFNRRMRQMPTFGRDTIRKFWHDVSARKQLAARDFEDFLICIMPAFEGLLPLANDQIVADLLFELGNWHALAKLRLQTTVTVSIFRAVTQHMCRAMRSFARTTCRRYEARELPKELEARIRREEKSKAGKSNRAPKIVRFNVLNTYKYHSLPDYPDFIEQGGTTDNYNSQVAELEHRHAKRYYRRTNKIGYAIQIAKHQRRATLLRALRELDDYVPRRERLRTRRATHAPHVLRQQVEGQEKVQQRREQESDDEDDEEDDMTPTPPLERYTISKTRCVPLRLSQWLSHHKDDAATRNFIPSLRAHVFGRLIGCDDPEEISLEELDHVHIESDRIYRHKTLRVNYTTYDMRREQDVISPRAHADLMVLADGSERDVPFWYGRLIDIFHAYVRYDGPGATPATRRWQRLDFLWVRWYENDPDYSSGFQERRLPRVRFIDANDDNTLPFGFLDPCEVIRGAYLMPAFAFGQTCDLLGPSGLARRGQHTNDDFKYYYVGMFADRDMFMRHLGGGVGHRGIGVSLAQSRQHAHRYARTTTPDDISDAGDNTEGQPDHVVSFQESQLEEDNVDGRPEVLEGEEEEEEEEEEEQEDLWGEHDEEWHFDAGFGGLFPEEEIGEGEGDGQDHLEDGFYDEYGMLIDPYSMEGYGPL
ncbi:hypothetical protein PYCCODRAFT_1439845 [Trametes coccinea BRFM310]|uniref:Uncharacterized protein n=1 Tax=Trametes coccinea (strain BRFM310) TaxID=1353009 RepID=A0A1Y2I9G0_TRAC3|nr:hypothetical protein PYCCODRAFT_1439845 [Trametes coccinea BRFM310]